MTWSNFHSHSEFCDGKLGLERYLSQAIRLDMKAIGFSGHAPLPFECRWCMKSDKAEEYLKTISNLQRDFQSEIEIYGGMEVDYIPDIISPSDPKIKAFDLDFIVGSIHFLDSFDSGQPWEIDGAFNTFKLGLSEIYHGNIQRVVQKYFALTREMITNHTPDIIGHIDKIKIHNRHQPLFKERDPWYQREVKATLEILAQSDSILEVNTRGLYTGKAAETYPSIWVLELARKLDVPITLNSDAHHPKDLIQLFPETAHKLNQVGFRTLKVLMGHQWVDLPFDHNGFSEAI